MLCSFGGQPDVRMILLKNVENSAQHSTETFDSNPDLLYKGMEGARYKLMDLF